MKNFYSTFSFMIAFMVLLVFINMVFGAKFTERFLWLVLASMIVMNTDKFEEITKGLKEPKVETHISSSGEVHGGGGGSY